MNPARVATTFVVVFLAELPDKTMIASLVMSTRLRASAVFVGVAGAFAVHVAIATAAGHALSLLPRTLVEVVVAILFAAGAAYLWFVPGSEVEERGERTADQAAGGRSFLSVALAAFGVIFLAEWGDLTQLATAQLAARSGDPLSVAIGAVLALWCVAGLAAWAGSTVLGRLPVRTVRRVAAVVFLGAALYGVVQLAT